MAPRVSLRQLRRPTAVKKRVSEPLEAVKDAPATHTYVAGGRASGPSPTRATTFRPGQWVVVANLFGETNPHVAIFMRPLGASLGEVHVVDSESGETLAIAGVPLSSIETASLEDIPAQRRPQAHARYPSRRGE